jgi:hypothetical protein
VVSSFRWLGLHRNPQRYAWTQTGQIANDRLTNTRQVRLHPVPPRSLWKHHTRDIVSPSSSMTLGPVHQSGRRPPPPPRAQTDAPSQRLLVPSSSASLSVGLHQTNRPALHARLHPAALARFQHPMPVSHTRPTSFKTPVYGAKYNMRRIHQIRPSSTPRERTHIRSSVLRCIGPNASTPLNPPQAPAGSEQARTKDATPNPSTPRFHGHPHPKDHLHQSDMVLWVLTTAPTSATATPAVASGFLLPQRSSAT